MPSIGERIRERRDELGWTQDVLAERAGISKGFLSDLENNKRSIGATKLHDIARVLNVSLDYLMAGTASKLVQKAVRVPASLSQFAGSAGLEYREVMALLDMQRQIVAHRSDTRSDDLERVDWARFYHRVKEFL